MSAQAVRRRTVLDVGLGILLVIAGFIILGEATIATIVSVRFLGWAALIIGIAEIIGGLMRRHESPAWSALLGGALLAALGLLILRNTVAAALTLTLVAAALFLASGVTRIALAFVAPEHRLILLIGGIASAVLGIIVLFNIVTATLTLLGVLLGIQVLVEGFTLLFLGRVHLERDSDAKGAAAA